MAAKGATMKQSWCLVPFDPLEAITLKQAAGVIGKSEATTRRRCEQFGIGRRVAGGGWAVSRPALAMFVDGDHKALQAYLQGDRESPEVESYFTRFGLGSTLVEIREMKRKS